jgi:hypothetical protein
MKTIPYKKSLSRLIAIALFSFLFLLFSQGAFAQDFSSLDSGLQLLEDLMKNLRFFVGMEIYLNGGHSPAFQYTIR